MKPKTWWFESYYEARDFLHEKHGYSLVDAKEYLQKNIAKIDGQKVWLILP